MQPPTLAESGRFVVGAFRRNEEVQKSQERQGKKNQAVESAQLHKGNFYSQAKKDQAKNRGDEGNEERSPPKELVESFLQKRSEAGRLAKERKDYQDRKDQQNYPNGGLKALILEVDF